VSTTEDPIRLHLGCGSTVVAGWVNVDRSPNVHLARLPVLKKALGRLHVLTAAQTEAQFPSGIVRIDVTKGLPFPDGSVEYAYSSHMIEHLSRWQGLALGREIRRVLAPGGVVRFNTPDLAAIVAEYSRTGDGDWLMQALGTFKEEPGSVVQRFVRRALSASAHQWLYDERSLAALLVESGLDEPTRRSYREGACPDLELLEVRSEGQYMEATKLA